jgi:ubiquinone/menaquinone biosynthesis C-methylase UbiE
LEESALDPKTLVQSQFGANAERYAVSRVHAEGESLARLVQAVRPHKDWLALDIATGPGHTAFAFAAHVRHVVASDLTPEMLHVARGIAAKRGLSNVSFAEAQAEKLPFADDSFDLVICRTAPHHFADVPVFVTEVARLLRPGGVFGLVDNISPDDAKVAADHNAFEKLRDPSHGRCLSEREWLDLIARAGLVMRHREILTKDIELEGWAGRMQAAPEIRATLRSILLNSSPGLRAFLRPQENAGNIDFVLTESLIVAEKPR